MARRRFPNLDLDDFESKLEVIRKIWWGPRKAVRKISNPEKAKQQDEYEEEKQDTLASLNDDVLIKIFSYCGPWEVCRFSRTCCWAKAFVDSNLRHVPRLRGSLIIQVNDEEAKYKLLELVLDKKRNTRERWLKFNLELKNFEVSPIHTHLTCVKLERVSVACDSISASYSRFIIQELVKFEDLSVAFSCKHNKMRFNFRTKDSEDMAKAQYVLSMPLELVCDDFVPGENRTKIQEMLLATLRSPYYIEVNLSGTCKTLEQCFVYLLRAMKVHFGNTAQKDLVKKSDLILTSQISFGVLDCWRNKNGTSDGDVACLNQTLEHLNLSSLFEVGCNSSGSLLMLRPKQGRFHIQIMLSFADGVSVTTFVCKPH